jgi:hypothetical protein
MWHDIVMMLHAERSAWTAQPLVAATAIAASCTVLLYVQHASRPLSGPSTHEHLLQSMHLPLVVCHQPSPSHTLKCIIMQERPH